MDRRRAVFAALCLSVIANASAQTQTRQVPRVAIFFGSSASSVKSFEGAFIQGLAALGRQEGVNLRLDRYYADGDISRVPALAEQIVSTKPDVIFAPTNDPTDETRKRTRTIPIVFSLYSDDPVARGLAASFARPGGNVTGFTNLTRGLTSKRLELLREIVPNFRRLGILSSRGTALPGQLQELRPAASQLGIEIVEFEPGSRQDYDEPFAAMKKQRVDALLVLGAIPNFNNRRRISELAIEQRLPTMHFTGLMVEAGGLISYAADYVDLQRRAAGYVDRILKGEKPADLPIQLPTKFELIVNQRTARAIGITIPGALLLRADRVID